MIITNLMYYVGKANDLEVPKLMTSKTLTV